MGSELVLAADIISVAAALTLVYSTLGPCKLSGIQYLLGVPAGFALVAVGFLAGIPNLLAGSSMPPIGLMSGVVSLLTQTYGLLFISLTYARKTRLRILGESIILEITIPALITIGAVTFVLISEATSGEILSTLEAPLRIVMALAALYVLYETERNWSFTQKASEGIVCVAFGALFVEQVGFLLTPLELNAVTTFVAYEGRLVGLFILIALTVFGVRKDHTSVLKRLGLTALAH